MGPPARWNITDGPCRPNAMTLLLHSSPSRREATFHSGDSSVAVIESNNICVAPEYRIGKLANIVAKSPKVGRTNHRKRTVTPTRRPNAEIRTREYLAEAEVEKLAEAAKGNRYGHCDATSPRIGCALTRRRRSPTH